MCVLRMHTTNFGRVFILNMSDRNDLERLIYDGIFLQPSSFHDQYLDGCLPLSPSAYFASGERILILDCRRIMTLEPTKLVRETQG